MEEVLKVKEAGARLLRERYERTAEGVLGRVEALGAGGEPLPLPEEMLAEALFQASQPLLDGAGFGPYDLPEEVEVRLEGASLAVRVRIGGRELAEEFPL